MSVPLDARFEQQPEPLVFEIPHLVGDAPDLFRDEVVGLDGTPRDAGHMEVKDLSLPA